MSDPENPPAFPRDERYLGHNGMTLRDWFAGQAMKYALDYVSGASPADIPAMAAADAYVIADAMLTARQTGEPA